MSGAEDGRLLPQAAIGTPSVENVPDEATAPGFAPEEPTDERPIGDWKSRYQDKLAKRAIQFEAAFVWGCLIITIASVLAIAMLSTSTQTLLEKSVISTLSPFVLSYIGGVLGGTLFAMKWLYHTVARGLWNRDRRLWRIFTPFLSGGAALTVILLCASGVVPLFGADVVRTNVGALGLSIVFGYFSDRAFSSLERLAEANLGSSRKAQKKKNA